jgi:hemoglobin
MKTDIRERADIESLVTEFYRRVRGDELLAHIFSSTILGEEWPRHEARVCDFWETVLLGRAKFKSTALMHHLEVDKICPLCPFHFDRWCRLFEATVDSRFGGDCAERAKQRAWAMSAAMQRQMDRERSGCPFGGLVN